MKSASLIPFIVSFLLFVALIAAYLFWYAKVGELSSRVASLSAEIAAKKSDATRLAAAQASLAAISADTDSIERYFVASDEVVPFLEELQATGKSFGSAVDIASVSADLKSAQPHLTLSLKIEGSFDAVMRTLGAFEHAARDLTVSDVSLASSGTGWVATGTIVVGSHDAAKKGGAAATTTP